MRQARLSGAITWIGYRDQITTGRYGFSIADNIVSIGGAVTFWVDRLDQAVACIVDRACVAILGWIRDDRLVLQTLGRNIVEPVGVRDGCGHIIGRVVASIDNILLTVQHPHHAVQPVIPIARDFVAHRIGDDDLVRTLPRNWFGIKPIGVARGCPEIPGGVVFIGRYPATDRFSTLVVVDRCARVHHHADLVERGVIIDRGVATRVDHLGTVADGIVGIARRVQGTKLFDLQCVQVGHVDGVTQALTHRPVFRRVALAQSDSDRIDHGNHAVRVVVDVLRCPPERIDGTEQAAIGVVHRAAGIERAQCRPLRGCELPLVGGESECGPALLILWIITLGQPVTDRVGYGDQSMIYIVDVARML